MRPFGERSPRLVRHPILAHDLVIVGALIENMGLDLVDRRCDVVVGDEIDEPVGMKIRHPDGAGPALTIQFLHRPPRSVVVAERLMDEIEIDVVQAQSVQRPLECGLGRVVAGVLHPQLGGHEQLIAWDAAAVQGASDGLFVLIRRGGVDVPVAGVQRLADDRLGVVGGHLEDAESQDRDLDSVVQRDGVHGSSLSLK